NARMLALDADPEAAFVPAQRPAATATRGPQAQPVPSQNLAGLEQHLRHITGQIEALRQQPQLQEGLAALREALSDIARTLLDEIDGASASDGDGEATQRNALEILNQRVVHIAEALESRVQNGGSVPPQLEAVIQSLTDKIERLQHSGSDGVAVGHLEDRIARLVEKLDASGARFSQLEAIERGLADLLVQIENRRGADTVGGVPPVDGLQRDLARTQTSLEAVHGTLGHVVDRLAMLESDLRDTRNPSPQAVQAPI